MNNIGFYIFCLIAIIVAVTLVKKFVGCVFRSIVLIILIALIALGYYYFGR